MTHQRIGLELPIVQAPMAGSQGSALAVAVSNAGGLGSLPCAMLAPDGVASEIAAIKAQTSRPFNVNFFCHPLPAAQPEREAAWKASLAPYYAEFRIDPSNTPSGPARNPFDRTLAELIAGSRPPVVSFHFGLPDPDLVAFVKSLGSKVWSSATTVEEARWLEARGVDAVIAQGVEAGGHRGIFLSEDLTTQVGTLALVPQVVRAVRVPVIAAGGIATCEAVQAVLALGASAAQIGTTFLLCPEAATTPVHRAALAGAGSRHTALTNVFTGRPARGIVNRFMREVGPLNEGVPAFPLAVSALAPLRTAAERQGRGDFSALWCGQNAAGCEEISAGDLTRRLAGV